MILCSCESNGASTSIQSVSSGLERVGGEAIVIDVEEYANLMIIFRLLELFLADKLFCCNWRKFSLHFATFSLHYFFPNRSNYLWLKKRRGGGRDGVT
jgi:hypothetical protein